MLSNFALIAFILGIFMIVERLWPSQELKKVEKWWESVMAINTVQMLIGVGIYMIEDYIPMQSRLNLKVHMSPELAFFIGYICHTYVMYWWHLFRHKNYFCWLYFHQFHHSIHRIEAISSFYKHPLEMFVNSIIMTILLYPILGLQSGATVYMSVLASVGEFFYHMNLNTPQIIGYFIQRPESHRLHHLYEKRVDCDNYGDISLWDIMNATFKNPFHANVLTGFKNEQERGSMILGIDVVDKDKKLVVTYQDICTILILVIGLISITGFVFFSPTIQTIGTVTASSPLPFVFSAYNGTETFAFDYVKTVVNNNTEIDLKYIYQNIDGPYNRRNVFGVALSYGVLFRQSNLIEMRNSVLQWAICKKKIISANHLVTIPDKIMRVDFTIKSKTKFQDKTWLLTIICP